MNEIRPVLDQLNIVVPDMDSAVEFYRLLGVEVADTLPEWRSHHRGVEVGGRVDVDLDSGAFAVEWDEGWPAGSAGVVMGFRVATRDAVDELHDRIVAAGHRSQQPPVDRFWGARYAVVEDPAGNAVGIMSPVEPARRTSPPEPPS